jgi:glycosyltransferase involved in cell wall biosynthesis
MFSAHLAAHLPEYGVDGHVVMIEGAGELPRRLDALRVPYSVYGAKRGRNIVCRPQRFARLVSECGTDGAILGWPGYVAATLRLGGYRAPLIAVEHGAQLNEDRRKLPRRIYKRLDWCSGVWATEHHVAVSYFALARLLRGAHKGCPTVIHNGVDLTKLHPVPGRAEVRRDPVVIGAVSRLVAGKGIDVLLRSLASLRKRASVRLLIAGDGPERGSLQRLAARLEVDQDVAFLGWIDDLSGFWARCDIAATPSDSLVEAFGLSAVEPMACALPVVAARNGGLSEVVEDQASGLLVAPGDPDALAAAFERYVLSEELRTRHGAAGRERAERHFDIKRAARAYADLVGDLRWPHSRQHQRWHAGLHADVTQVRLRSEDARTATTRRVSFR